MSVNSGQINNCLFNGNYKLGKLCGGWHSVDTVKDKGITLPDNLPDNTSAFLYFSGNVVFYIAGGKGYYNTDSTGHLTDTQKASYDYILDIAKGKKVSVENIQLGWHNVGGGKGLSLADKVAKLF